MFDRCTRARSRCIRSMYIKCFFFLCGPEKGAMVIPAPFSPSSPREGSVERNWEGPGSTVRSFASAPRSSTPPSTPWPPRRPRAPPRQPPPSAYIRDLTGIWQDQIDGPGVRDRLETVPAVLPRRSHVYSGSGGGARDGATASSWRTCASTASGPPRMAHANVAVLFRPRDSHGALQRHALPCFRAVRRAPPRRDVGRGVVAGACGPRAPKK